jgi:hypothetical protein
VINVAGATDVILYDGPNDYGSYGILAQATIDAYKAIVVRVQRAGLRIYGATLTSPKGDPSGGYGTPAGLANRVVINTFIRTSRLFDGVEDFDAATFDPATGGIWPQFVPNSTTGGTIRIVPVTRPKPTRSISLRSHPGRGVRVAPLARLTWARQRPRPDDCFDCGSWL